MKPLLKPSSHSNLYHAPMRSPCFGLPPRNQITRLDLRERLARSVGPPRRPRPGPRFACKTRAPRVPAVEQPEADAAGCVPPAEPVRKQPVDRARVCTVAGVEPRVVCPDRQVKLPQHGLLARHVRTCPPLHHRAPFRVAPARDAREHPRVQVPPGATTVPAISPRLSTHRSRRSRRVIWFREGSPNRSRTKPASVNPCTLPRMCEIKTLTAHVRNKAGYFG